MGQWVMALFLSQNWACRSCRTCMLVILEIPCAMMWLDFHEVIIISYNKNTNNKSYPAVDIYLLKEVMMDTQTKFSFVMYYNIIY